MPISYKHTFLITVLFTLLFNNASSQNPTIEIILAQQKNKIPDSLRVVNNYKLGKLYANNNDSTNAVNYLKAGIALSLKVKQYKLTCYGYNELGYLYELMDEPLTGLKYYQQAINIAKANSIYPSLARAYSNSAFAYKTLGKQNKTFDYNDSAANIYLKSKNYTESANIYNNTGLNYHELNQNDKALLFFNKALNIYENYPNDYKKSFAVLNIGLVYLRTKSYSIAEKYFNEAINLANTSNNTSVKTKAKNNLGVIAFEQNNFEKAIAIYTELKKVFKETNDEYGYHDAIGNIAVCQSSLKNYDAAEKAYKENELWMTKKMNHDGLTVNLINQSYLYGVQKRNKESLNYALKALDIVNNNKGLGRYKEQIFLNLSAIYKNTKDYDQALTYIDSANFYKDLYYNEKSNNSLLELQTKYETERKELKIGLLAKSDSINTLRIQNQQIAINQGLLLIANKSLLLSQANLQLAEDSLQLGFQRELLLQKKLDSSQQHQKINTLNQQQKINQLQISKKNNAILAISIFTVLSLLTAYLLYKRYQLKKKNELQQKENELQQKAIIDVLAAEEKERKRIAAELHDGIGQTMTAALLNMRSIQQNQQVSPQEKEDLFAKALLLLDDSCKEVRNVSHNMMPNVLIKKGLVNAVKDFLNQLNVKGLQINIESEGLQKNIPPHIETVLYRVIQESVNNVIKHAKASKLFITLYNEADGIDLMIEDNGVGFDKKNINTDGIGLSNIESRIKYLKGSVEWDSQPNNGTVVSIHIPLQ